MAYWLFKSEPGSWSWEMQKAKGAAGQEWDGVRNFQARANMRKMQKGERGFFYHTGDEKRIVGIVEVMGEYRPDPSDAEGRFGLVEVKAVENLPRPITLAAIKADPKLKDMVLVKNSRLSVQPVSAAEWAAIRKMGGLK